MRHISIELHPRDHGLTPYQVTFKRAESHPLRSMLDDGVWYQHPEHTDSAIVWAKDADAIPEVLTYHYPHTWSELHVVSSQMDKLPRPR